MCDWLKQHVPASLSHTITIHTNYRLSKANLAPDGLITKRRKLNWYHQLENNNRNVRNYVIREAEYAYKP